MLALTGTAESFGTHPDGRRIEALASDERRSRFT
jgi:hypothetical protein